MPIFSGVPLHSTEIVTRTIREIDDDNCLGLAAQLAFYYVTNLANFNATYGAIGGVVVLLLWFYVSGLAILIGAELNGVIEQAVKASLPATRSKAEAGAGRRV